MQDAVFDKLAGCFGTVFPALPKNDIPAATHDTVPEWDSVAQITLLSLVADEFQLDIDFEEFEDAVSFPLLLDAVRRKMSNGQ